MGKRPTLLFLIPHAGGGGAERVTTLLAEGLSTAKYEVHLGVVTGGGPCSDAAPSWIPVHPVGAKRVRTAGPRLLALVRRIRPDLVFSAAPHLNFLILLLKPLFPRNTRLLVRQSRTASAQFRSGRWPDHSRLLYRQLYPHADAVICPTAEVAIDLAAYAGLGDLPMHVLPNPVDDLQLGAGSDEAELWPGPGPHLLAVGRLAHEKGFDLLLNAFATLRAKYPQAELRILGEGAERATLTRHAADLRLGAAVRLDGRVAHPSAWFAGSTLLVLPSRTEGLPNALLEAAAAGLPLVATPCSQSVINLLSGAGGAWLADDLSSDALARSIDEALQSLCPGERFSHSWTAPFRRNTALARWEALIDRTLTGLRP